MKRGEPRSKRNKPRPEQRPTSTMTSLSLLWIEVKHGSPGTSGLRSLSIRPTADCLRASAPTPGPLEAAVVQVVAQVAVLVEVRAVVVVLLLHPLAVVQEAQVAALAREVAAVA